MTITVGDLLANVMQHREAALATEDQAARQRKALAVIEEAMFVMHKLLGVDLLASALGTVDETDRVSVLRTAAQRLHAMSGLFGKMPLDAASPFKVVEEAVSISRGDAPLMFARIDRQKVKHRVLMAKAGALRWDAYLDGLGLAVADRHARIAKAYGTDWLNIEKWKQRELKALDCQTTKYLISVARNEGRQGEPRWESLGDTDWQSALERDGQQYLTILAENKGNR